MRIFNTICKKCGKQCDEDMDNCLVCGSKAIYYQADLTKKEAFALRGKRRMSKNDFQIGMIFMGGSIMIQIFTMFLFGVINPGVSDSIGGMLCGLTLVIAANILMVRNSKQRSNQDE